MNASLDWDISSDMLAENRDEMWDFCPDQFDDESFLSWFTRLAKENCSDVSLLYQKLRNDDNPSLRKINTAEIERKLNSLEVRTVDQDEILKKLSPYCDITNYCRPEKMIEFSLNSAHPFAYLITNLRTPRYCSHCLQEDETPYFRSHWFYKFITYCDKHKCLLNDYCPYCYSPIKFWKTNWDEPISVCFHCKKDISHNISIISKINSDFQDELYSVVKNAEFKGDKIDPILFFQQFWKVMINECLDPKLKAKDFTLPAERMFRALNSAYGSIELYKHKFYLPYCCPIDNQGFASKIDYDLHMFLCHTQNSPKDSKLEKRCEVIKQFLEKGITTHQGINQSGIHLEMASGTIYHWILEYK
ncbi:MAG: TniQ family protein, partial [Promethearchaeota archaeon]